MMKTSRDDDQAKIHIAKKQLQMDEQTYRDMLWLVAHVHSSSHLDEDGRKKVLNHLRSCGAKFKRAKRSTPAISRENYISKIKAMLAEAKRPDTYADGMAKNMFKVDRYEWLELKQLGKLVAALVYDAKRNGRRA